MSRSVDWNNVINSQEKISSKYKRETIHLGSRIHFRNVPQFAKTSQHKNHDEPPCNLPTHKVETFLPHNKKKYP